MWIIVVIIVAFVLVLVGSCEDGTSAPEEGNSELTACYAWAERLAEEGHSRDKQWLNDQLDYCDRTYG